MGTIVDAFKTAFRDYLTEGVAGSGAYEPEKALIRAIGPLLESSLSTLSLGSVSVVKTTRALLNADLAYAANSTGLVYADADPANNEIYVKSGAPGAGAWTRTNAIHDAIEGAAQPYVDEIQTLTDEIFSFILQGFGSNELVGRKGDPVTGDAAASGPLAYVINRVFPAYSIATGFKIFGGSVGGNVTIAPFVKDGDDFEQQGAGVVIPVTAGILNTFNDLEIKLLSGQMLGVVVPNATTARYSATLPADDGGWYSGAAPDFTDASVFAGAARLEWSFTVRVLDPSSTTGRKPLAVVADGNSLTSGSGGVTAWPSILATEMRITVSNKGVSGQNLDAMIADFASEIAPLAIQDGYRTLYIIDGEPYNLLRAAGDTVAQAVAKMLTLANLAFDAGFDYVMVVNSGSHNTATNVVQEGQWNRLTSKAAVNTEILTVFDDTQVILVDIGSAPQLSDYTDLDFYQVDGVHYSDDGQNVVCKRISAKVAIIL